MQCCCVHLWFLAATYKRKLPRKLFNRGDNQICEFALKIQTPRTCRHWACSRLALKAPNFKALAPPAKPALLFLVDGGPLEAAWRAPLYIIVVIRQRRHACFFVMSTACLGLVIPRIANKEPPLKAETVSSHDDYLTIRIPGEPGSAAVAPATGHVAVFTTIDTNHVA